MNNIKANILAQEIRMFNAEVNAFNHNASEYTLEDKNKFINKRNKLLTKIKFDFNKDNAENVLAKVEGKNVLGFKNNYNYIAGIVDINKIINMILK